VSFQVGRSDAQPLGPLPPAIRGLVERVAGAGGRALLVGGAVIDALTGDVPEDWDIEVHGLSMDRLETLLGDFSPRAVGKSFGVFILDPAMVDGLKLSVSVPRRESKVGVGHRDFRCEFDPLMTPREAARRRDFTINSVMLDLHQGEIVDPYNGLRDLKAGLLRMTDGKTFVEDPLRGLRAMQLLARKAQRIDQQTLDVIRGMVDTYDALPRERVADEWEKLLLKAERPSMGLEFLRESGWLRHYPELLEFLHWSGWERAENQIHRQQFSSDGCPQNPEWHPEGDVWIHNNLVVDAAARVRHQIDPEWRLAFMYGALLHDIAKPPTTELPRCTAYGHDKLGEQMARSFMERLTANRLLIDRVAALVRTHLAPFMLVKAGSSEAAWKRLHRRCFGRLDVLGWLTLADWAGRPARDPIGPLEHGKPVRHEGSEACRAAHERLGIEPILPLVQGRDLIAAGWTPGPRFGAALEAAFEAQLDHPDWSRERLLEIALATAGD
jgi:tRNA nucleotidyltransferase (CCA-adding enzyme)